jgi:hypothetical protein
MPSMRRISRSPLLSASPCIMSPAPGSMRTRFSSGPSFFIARICSSMSSSVNWPAPHLLLHARRLVHVHRLRRALHQADHVAHAQDARRHALRVKRLEIVELLADAHELDRLAGDRFEAQRRTAAGVAIELGQDRAGDVQRLVEVGGDADRLLAGGGVEHEQDFLGMTPGRLQADEFLHQRFVDLQAAGGIEQHRVVAFDPARSRASRAMTRTSFSPRMTRTRGSELLAERLQLVHGRRTVHVGRDQQHACALLDQERASLPDEVVLPEPCNPPSGCRTDFGAKWSAALLAPSSSTSSSWMIFTTCSPGLMLWMTCWPMALSFTFSMKSRATLKFTSASSRAKRTSRSDSEMLDSEMRPRPRRSRKTFWSFLLSESNTRRT